MTLDPPLVRIGAAESPPQGTDIDEAGALASGNTIIRGAARGGAPHPASDKGRRNSNAATNPRAWDGSPGAEPCELQGSVGGPRCPCCVWGRAVLPNCWGGGNGFGKPSTTLNISSVFF
ncbi:hypothetical protein TcCL_ESM10539 [Trypanosoma cruzi]|nr:hypothetical protein TcCL_ESM10539 [Trypanosoma cruzi]